MEQVFFTIQIPHSYKSGTVLDPHIHWTPTTNATGVVKWNLEYSWASIGDTFTTSVTISNTATAGGTPWVHKYIDLGSITATANNISGVSSMLVCRLYRDPTLASDTYTADAGFLEFDIHIEMDTFGSRQEAVK